MGRFDLSLWKLSTQSESSEKRFRCYFCYRALHLKSAKMYTLEISKNFKMRFIVFLDMESPARVPFQFLPPHQEILLLAILHLQSPFMKLKFWRNFLKIDLNLSLLKFRNEISCCRRNFER